MPGRTEFRDGSCSSQKRQQFVKLSVALARTSAHAWGLCTKFRDAFQTEPDSDPDVADPAAP